MCFVYIWTNFHGSQMFFRDPEISSIMSLCVPLLSQKINKKK